MSCTIGEKLKVTVFGQSHSAEIGVVIDGLPAGFEIDFDALAAFTARRTAINKPGVTARKEPDSFEIVSGLFNGKTCGAPLCAKIKNTDVRSADYEKLSATPRPSHADYTAFIKHNGFADYRGGGNFSGRMTAPLVLAGGIALQLLAQRGITVFTRIKSIGNVQDKELDLSGITANDLQALDTAFPVFINKAQMLEQIEQAAQSGDSIGGRIQCFMFGVPCGLGEPIFDGMESVISRYVFAIPAIKGIEFGAGFAITGMPGSLANDGFTVTDGVIKTLTNNSGGIQGGIANGMPLVFTAAVKPTPSIAKPQKSVNLGTMMPEELCIAGRHDPCIVLRALPAIEAAAALAVADLLAAEGEL